MERDDPATGRQCHAQREGQGHRADAEPAGCAGPLGGADACQLELVDGRRRRALGRRVRQAVPGDPAGRDRTDLLELQRRRDGGLADRAGQHRGALVDELLRPVGDLLASVGCRGQPVGELLAPVDGGAEPVGELRPALVELHEAVAQLHAAGRCARRSVRQLRASAGKTSEPVGQVLTAGPGRLDASGDLCGPGTDLTGTGGQWRRALGPELLGACGQPIGPVGQGLGPVEQGLARLVDGAQAGGELARLRLQSALEHSEPLDHPAGVGRVDRLVARRVGGHALPGCSGRPAASSRWGAAVIRPDQRPGRRRAGRAAC